MLRSVLGVLMVSVMFVVVGFGQDRSSNQEGGKFKKENLFLGSGFNLGFSGNSFNLGLNPEIGYSLTNWADAGIALNLQYLSQNPSGFSTIKYQNLSYGAGSYLRIWPVNFMHLQIQPEYNWISSSQKNASTGDVYKYHFQAASLLMGLGYGSHFVGGRYSYVTLMIDVLQNTNSPYRDQYNDPIPVFRAGFGMYLRPDRK